MRVMLPETDLESFPPFSRAPTKTYVVAKDDQNIRVLTLGKTMLDRFILDSMTGEESIVS